MTPPDLVGGNKSSSNASSSYDNTPNISRLQTRVMRSPPKVPTPNPTPQKEPSASHVTDINMSVLRQNYERATVGNVIPKHRKEDSLIARK